MDQIHIYFKLTYHSNGQGEDLYANEGELDLHWHEARDPTVVLEAYNEYLQSGLYHTCKRKDFIPNI